MKNRIIEHLSTASRGVPGLSRVLSPGDASRLVERHWLRPWRKALRRNPAAVLAAAFGAGVALAWWIKRR